MIIHWDRWHCHFAGILSRGWLDQKIWSQATRLFQSMEGRYRARRDSEVSWILCRLSVTYPKTRRFSIKQGSFGTTLLRARCRSTYPFPQLHALSGSLLLLFSWVPVTHSATPLGTFWNWKGVWELHYEVDYFKKKLIIILFRPSAFYSGGLRYTLPFLWFVL